MWRVTGARRAAPKAPSCGRTRATIGAYRAPKSPTYAEQGGPRGGAPQTLSAADTFQAPLVDCRKYTVGPGFTRAAAHIVGEAMAHWYLSMVDPAGSAARMDDSVHSPVAEAAEPADVVALAATELEGVPGVVVADVLVPLEESDEHPVSNASPMPPKTTRSAVLLTVV